MIATLYGHTGCFNRSRHGSRRDRQANFREGLVGTIAAVNPSWSGVLTPGDGPRLAVKDCIDVEGLHHGRLQAVVGEAARRAAH